MPNVKQQFQAGLETIKALTGLQLTDFDVLKKAAPQATQWSGEVVTLFYDTLFDHSRTAAVFHAGERPDREKTLESWYLSLFDVDDEREFFQSQTRIGLAHIRRHVNNEFMIGIAARVRELFQSRAVQTFGHERGIEISQAFDRVINAVVGLTAEGYDLLSRAALMESTGASPMLIDRLIQQSVDELGQELVT
jgi:hypothetical protein